MNFVFLMVLMLQMLVCGNNARDIFLMSSLPITLEMEKRTLLNGADVLKWLSWLVQIRMTIVQLCSPHA